MILELLFSFGYFVSCEGICVDIAAIQPWVSRSIYVINTTITETPLFECVAICRESTNCSFSHVDQESLTCYIYVYDAKEHGASEYDVINRTGVLKEEKILCGTIECLHTDRCIISGGTFLCIPRGANLAFNKTTSQSYTYSHAGTSLTSDLAVDGNTDGVWSHHSCSCIKSKRSGHATWWSVDLGAVYNIGYVVIANRVDCCASLLSRFTVMVGNKTSTRPVHYRPCLYFRGWFEGCKTLTCDKAVWGQYIRIHIVHKTKLVLCEVEVYENVH